MATFYRAVNHWPPARDEFLSDQAKGLPPRPEQIRDPRTYAGISVFDSLEHIHTRRKRYPRFPPLTAQLEIPDGTSGVEKTLGRGHYSLIGDPDTLMRYIVGLVQ